MPNNSSKRIMIVDDTEANRYSVMRTLTHVGYEVTECATIKQAMAGIKKSPPDLLILDINLPDGNGYSVCKKLKEDANTAPIPILLTSAAFVEGRDKAFGLESGADGYLTTPYDPLELVATIRSMLRVREAEENVRKSQEVFRTMADSIPAMVWMAGTDKLCYYFNKAWCDFTGRTLAQEQGDGWREGIHKDDKERCMDIYNTAFSQQASFEMTYRLRRADGEYRCIMDRGEPHYNTDGNFAGYTGACIEVHDKIMTERKLRESEERFGLAMKGMNDGLWDWDLVTGEIYYGPRYISMLGYEEHEFPGIRQATLDRIHPEDLKNSEDIIQKYIDGQIKEYKNIFRLQHKNGEYRWILSRAQALRDENGRAYRMVGAHTDISEQKELERELREASARAESANSAKTEFLANMSHEIRTPMNAIIGLAHILSVTSLNDKQKQFVETLKSSADSMMTLINDMLDIAKIEDNMIELENIQFSLRELIDDVLGMMAVKAQEKSLDIMVEYGGNVGEFFCGDPLRIKQIIVNLTSNAIKFTSRGSIRIAIDQVASSGDKAQKISFKVIDTGIGIPEEKLYSIFDKFTQADSSITRKYGGTGLGLTICKSLVDKMGGNIHVASKLGEGSVFTVNLPLPAAKNVKGADDNVIQMPIPFDFNQKGRKHILLVEDYQANIMVATTILEGLGYQYEVAVDGQEALQKLKDKKFDAVLMDIQMQNMDGYEATRRIRKWEKQKDKSPMPIIAMTAHALMGDREKCIEAGMNDYISKPFNPVELETKLANYLKSDRIKLVAET